MKKTASFIVSLIFLPMSALAAQGFDPAVSPKCSQFFNKASASFLVKNIKTSPSSKGYASFELGFLPASAEKIDTDDYNIAFTCKKTTDPSWPAIPLEQLTASIDYNRTTKYSEKIGETALIEYGKLVAYAGSLSEAEGRKKLAACFADASRNKTKLSPNSSRFDAAYEDGQGGDFSCFRISSARWSSYGFALSNGFNFKRAVLSK